MPDPFAFQWHPEVQLLVAFLTGAYVYMVRVIGPKAVRPGEAIVTRTQKIAFVGAMVMLWIASDYPLHDISEQYLYSAHMLQHMMLSYFIPPLALIATPTWLMRILIGDGRLYSVVRWFTRPVTAAVIFNAVVMLTHVPGMVNGSVANPVLHYTLHVLLVVTSLLMWMPVLGPFPELRMGPGAASIYLFLQSVVPTVPAGWLVFAEGVVYSSYGEQVVRLWGIDATTDQQIAGAIMKIGGAIFLWSVVVYYFFRKFAAPYRTDNSYRRGERIPSAEIVGHDDIPLTTADVERAFATAPAPSEPGR
ncbi:MAG: cytochrome c oxidase assembly protein [Ilumatobacteraceae bacterium]|nr:cytochrome c oxidase assembly protein [Ilumatobacteraceae bacterium]